LFSYGRGTDGSDNSKVLVVMKAVLGAPAVVVTGLVVVVYFVPMWLRD